MTGPPAQAAADGPPVVLITGGATGIGRACASACGRTGATVVLLSLPGPELSLAASELREAGVAAYAVVADVRDFESVQQAVSQVTRDLGRIDVLVTSAGIADQSSITGGSPERWQQVVQTNLLGTANSIRAVAPLMTQAGTGDIVIIASASGRDTYVGEPLYIASKWGVVGLGHALRKELQASNIRVALIEPGLVEHPADPGQPGGPPPGRGGRGPAARRHRRRRRLADLRPRRVAVTELVIRPAAGQDIERI